MANHKLAVGYRFILFCTAFVFGLGAIECRSENLTLAVSTLTYGHSPLWVAQRKGFYGQEGLEVEIPALESGSRAMQALLAGSAQLAATTPEDLIRATEAGTPTVILAGVLNGLTHSLMANSRIKRVSDLKGGKVAASSVTGSVTYALKLMLAKNNLHYPKDYLIIQSGGSGVRFAALKGGGIDAALVAEPLALVAEEAGLSNVGFVGDYLPHMQVTVIGVRSDWAKANRGLVVRYLKGLVRTFRWLYANKEEGIEATSAIAKVKRNSARADIKSIPKDGSGRSMAARRWRGSRSFWIPCTQIKFSPRRSVRTNM